MIRQLRIYFLGVVVFGISGIAHAQDAAAPAPAATAPPAAAKTADDATAPVLSMPHDPAVDTIVDSNPTTPAQLLRAALILADLDRIDLAKKYLAQLAASKPDENALAEAAGQIDPEMLLRIIAHPDLQPEGAQFASSVLAAASRMARDPQRMMEQIDRLANTSRSVRHEAIARILAAHEDAVPSLVLALADEKRAAVQPMVRQLLVKIGAAAVPPLVAALQTENAALKVQIINMLREIGMPEAIPYLVAPATSADSAPQVGEAASAALAQITGAERVMPSDAIKLLTKEIERDLKHDRPITTGADGRIDVWRWDANSGMPVREAVPPQQAWPMLAARLANDLLELAPDDATARRLFLISTLETAALKAGLNNAAPLKTESVQRATKLGAAAIEDALSFAISTGHMPVATVAAQILGEIGDRSLLDARDGQVRPLVQAVSLGDRRLRFAAAEAIMRLKPTGGFAGSSDLLSALAFFADSPGVKRALVAHPNLVAASQLATLLSGMGYEADIATNGRQAYLQAISSGDYELVFLSGRLDRVPVWVLLQQLRRDPHTAALPIALMAEDETVEPERLKSMAEGDPLTVVFQRPLEASGLKFHVDRLLDQADGQLVPGELRHQQALAALGWLKELNRVSPKDFDLRPYEAALTRAFGRSQTSAAAAELLGSIGTHSAQKTLTEMADTSTQPLALRESAATAFSRAVRRYGIQLTTAEIRHQYDRFNQSSLEDKATQQLLGLMLDAIEEPTKK